MVKRRQVLQYSTSAIALLAFGPFAKALENATGVSIPWNDNTTPIKKTRSNPAHFWAWSKKHAPQFFDKNLSELLTIEGPCIGDAHPGNITTVADGNETGFAICDLDDGGQAPLYLDFCRLALFFCALDEETKQDKIKLDDLFQAYLAGLHQQQRKAPKSYVKTQAEIFAYHTEWVKSKLAKKDFLPAFSLGKPAKKEAKEIFKYIQENENVFFPEGKILEIGYTEDKVGASIGKMRFWILLDTKNGMLIYELKQLTHPGIGHYQAQSSSHKQRISEIIAVYSDLDQSNSLSDFNPSAENVFELQIQNTKYSFWRRLRHTSTYDTDDMTGKEQLEWTLYMAYWMGLKQGKLDAAQQLREIITDNFLSVSEKTNELVKSYLEVIKKK